MREKRYSEELIGYLFIIVMMSMIALYENNKGSYYGLMYEDGYIFQIMYVSLFIVEVMLYSKYIDYYLKKQCALILIRYQSRRKVLTIVLEKLCIRITIAKVIEVTIYIIINLLRDIKVNYTNVALSLLWGGGATIIICLIQLYIEVRLNGEYSIVITSIMHIFFVILGTVIQCELIRYYKKTEIINMIIISNYLYIGRVERYICIYGPEIFTMFLAIIFGELIVLSRHIKKYSVIEN